jgi:hypothetical protein
VCGSHYLADKQTGERSHADPDSDHGPAEIDHRIVRLCHRMCVPGTGCDAPDQCAGENERPPRLWCIGCCGYTQRRGWARIIRRLRQSDHAGAQCNEPLRDCRCWRN